MAQTRGAKPELTPWDEELLALRRTSRLKAAYLVESTRAVIAGEFAAVHDELTALESKMIARHSGAHEVLAALIEHARSRVMPALDTLRTQHGCDDSYGEFVAKTVVAGNDS